MELTIKTLAKGIRLLQGCYLDFNLRDAGLNYTDWLTPWHEILKLDISDEEFIPLLIQYCRTKPAPTCPADIINFKLNQESK